MSLSETHALGRAAVLLLVASLARLALAPAPSRPSSDPGDDVLPALMVETRARAEEEEQRTRPLDPGETVDPNGASAIELDRLPGVGPATASAWVRTREQGGPFAGPEDLLRVPGLGPKGLERVRGHLAWPSKVAGTSRSGRRGVAASLINVNRADTLALLALPGVGPALARSIVLARDSARFRTVDDLTRVRGIGPATVERLRPLVAVTR